MPTTLSKPSGFTPMAMMMVTVGALMTVWSGIWFWYLRNHSSGDGVSNYVCAGCLISGLVLLFLGIAAGPMARWTRPAELPPTGAGVTDNQGVPTQRF